MFAINIITLPINHGLQPIPHLDGNKTKFPGIHRILSFVSEYTNSRIESRNNENPVDLPIRSLQIGRPKSEKDKEKIRDSHHEWMDSLPLGSLIIYTDGSRSNEGDIGAGWKTYIIAENGIKALREGNCYLGSRMEVFDAELLAVYEALKQVSMDVLDQVDIFICIDNHSAIQALANNPDRIEGAFRATAIAYELIQ